MNQAALQPAGVRLFIVANVLLWGTPLPVHLALTLLAALWLPRRVKSLPRPVWLAFGGLLAYGLLTYFIGPCSDGGIKVIASAAMVAALFAAVGRLAGAVRPERPLLTRIEAVGMLALMVMAATIEYLYRSGPSAPLGQLRVGGLYSEPSHLALAAAPLIFWLWLRGGALHRLVALATAGLLLAISFSTTLLALLILLPLIAHLGQLIQRRINPVALVGLLALAAVPLALPLLAGTEATIQRLNDLVDLREDANLSSLVYANGWQLLESYFDSTRGLGLGLNAMGCSPRAYTEITGWLELINLGDQNFNDGSFILSKLGSEFGVVGLLFFVAIAVYSVRLLWRSGRRSSPASLALAAGWLAMIGLGGVIRSGGGYFAGPVLLALFTVLMLRNQAAPVAAATPAQTGAPA